MAMGMGLKKISFILDCHEFEEAVKILAKLPAVDRVRSDLMCGRIPRRVQGIQAHFASSIPLSSNIHELMYQTLPYDLHMFRFSFVYRGC